MYSIAEIEMLVANGDGVRKGEIIARHTVSGEFFRSYYDGTIVITWSPANVFVDVASKADGEEYLTFVAIR